MNQRTIKFRAWDKNEGVYRYPGDKEWEPTWILHQGLYEPYGSRFTLEQFTGLKDKNGKEIYEGDIVRILYTDWPSQQPNTDGKYDLSLEEYMNSIASIGKVEWHVDRWMLNFGRDRFGDYSFGRMEPGDHGWREVIGNVHQNPDLLSHD